MNNKNVLFILHRLYYEGKTKEGGIDFFIRFFREKKYNVYIIEHTLEDFKYPSKYIVNGKVVKKYYDNSKPPLRWGKEFLLNKKILKKYKVKFDYAYASDALNFLSVYWAKRNRIAKNIKFHCTDFSKHRFKNPLLNTIYLNIFKFSLNHADEINVVTPYVGKMAKKIAPKANIKFIPNSPIYRTFPKINPEKKDKHLLVITISQMSKRSNFDNYLEIIKLVKKEIPDIKLKIIGSCDSYVKKSIKDNDMRKNIIFTGLLPYEEAIKELASGYIGIVFYPKDIDHVKYGDSIKLREYAATGLASVSDNITFTSREMIDHGAGMTGNSPQEIAKHIVYLVKNDNQYIKMHKKALLWAQKMDKEKILENLIS